MFYLITGGSGSGKSEYAERVICEAGKRAGCSALFYIATMFPYGEETQAKIQRHKEMRSGKSFTTVECYTGLLDTAMQLAADNQELFVLLECMSNLAANELYMEGGAGDDAVADILSGVAFLRRHCRELVIVTNEVNGDGQHEAEEMRRYKRVMGELNCRMARGADRVVEVVYGIPVEVSG